MSFGSVVVIIVKMTRLICVLFRICIGHDACGWAMVDERLIFSDVSCRNGNEKGADNRLLLFIRYPII